MKNYCPLLLIPSLIACSAPPEQEAKSPLEGTWIDLTYSFSEETVYWPTAEPFRLDTVVYGESDGGFFYSAFEFTSAEHGGTHLDAPIHFADGRKATDDLEIQDLVGPGIVIDVSTSCADDRDYLVTQEDFEAWEESNGPIPDGSILLIRTGFGQYWPDRQAYLGTSKMGPDAIAELHFPGIHPDGASWLASNRNIKAIGIDTPSIDFGQSSGFEAHRILYEENIPGFENVANMDQLPLKGFYVFAFPMKIAGGSGGPLRIAALVPSS